MALHFKKYADEAEVFIETLASKLDQEDNLEKTFRILRSTLHGIRNHISINESLQLIAQLPMFLKAVYVDGWKISSEKNKSKSLYDFMYELRKFSGNPGEEDFPSEEDTENQVRTVFRCLRKYISLGELDDIRSALPKNLKSLLNSDSFV